MNLIFIGLLTAMTVMEVFLEVVAFTEARLQSICLSFVILTIKLTMPAFTNTLLKQPASFFVLLWFGLFLEFRS